MKTYRTIFLLGALACFVLTGCAKHQPTVEQEAASREYTKNFAAQMEKVDAVSANPQASEEAAEKERALIPTEERVNEEVN